MRGRPAFYRLRLAIVASVICLAATGLAESRSGATRQESDKKPLDPAAWGTDHVGKPTPEYVHGDECLFCHRNDIGPTWQTNAHGRAIRTKEDAPDLSDVLKALGSISPAASEVEYVMGSRNRVRFLKKIGYGKFAILSVQAVLSDGSSNSSRVESWINRENASWDSNRFAENCSGCHTTAVDPATKAFSAFGLDCYTCHGNVDLNHTNDTSLILLSKKRRDEARVSTAICAQCHIRGGKSRSTGLPYPNNFVPGDNLFKDYAVDFSKADDRSLNAGDRHVLRNVRDVVVYGSERPTCVSCHQVHGQSSFKHRRAARSGICIECHNAEGPLKVVKPYVVKSLLCEY